MRIHFDEEEERALLAARLNRDLGVGDSDLAASFAAWVDNTPSPGSGRKLTPADLENLNAVADWANVEDEAGGGSGGYASQSTWLGQG
jgi:hypothetical protein